MDKSQNNGHHTQAVFTHQTSEIQTLRLLEHLSDLTGVIWNPAVAREVLHQTDRDIGGSLAESWMPRLEQTCRDLGMRAVAAELSARELERTLGAQLPAFTLAPKQTPGSSLNFGSSPLAGESSHVWWLVRQDRPGWLVLQQVTATEDPTQDPVEVHCRASQLAKCLGLPRDQKIHWLLVQPLVPCPNIHDDHHSMPPLSRLFHLLRPERSDMFVLAIFALAVGFLSLGIPLAVDLLVTTVTFGGLQQPLFVVAFILFLVLGFSAILRGLMTYVVELLQRRLYVRLVSDFAYRVPRVPTQVWDTQPGPELMNRFFDVVTVQKAAAGLLLDGLVILTNALVGMVVLWYFHYWLFAFNIALIAAVALIILWIGRGAISSAVYESKKKYATAAWLEELAANPIAFKGSHAAEFALHQMDGLAQAYIQHRRQHFRIVFRQIWVSLFLHATASTLLLGLGGWLVLEGHLSIGQLVAAELIVNVILGSVSKLGKHMESFYDLLAAVDKLGHILDLPVERQTGERLPPLSLHRDQSSDSAELSQRPVHSWDSPGNGATAGHGSSLVLRNVGFAYQDCPDLVLKGVTFRVRPGERVALVGPNGCGKSTLVDLLFGLRDATQGYIELDGRDLRDLHLDSLRQRVALVRPGEILNASVLDNLRLGRPQLGVSDLMEALEIAGLRDVIQQLSDGLNTELFSTGQPLSKGQMRRLLIARAVAGSPSLLLLDESLDGLDAQSRRDVFQLLADHRRPWTLILISHHEELINSCDRVLHLEAGEIIADIRMEQTTSPLSQS